MESNSSFKFSILREMHLFSKTNDSFIEQLADFCEEMEFVSGETVFHKGAESDGLYIVLNGKLKIHDEQYTYAEMTEGQIIGEYSLLDTQPRSASVTATETSSLLFLNKSHFNDLLAHRPDVLQAILNIFTTRLRRHNEREENQHKEKEEIRKVKDELAEQQDFLMMQGDRVAEQKMKITESINYAKGIQRALLPSSDELNTIWPEHFVFFKPKDIVSGDFYWTYSDKRYKYIAAADCTGHGVPGAFMCMLGVSALNQISLKITENPDAGDILTLLRKNVIKTLHQKREDSKSKDGMDIAFCIFDTETNKLQFSGAYNPLYLIRNGELIKYKPNRMPIGVHVKDSEPFTKHEIDIEKDDVIYIFSDGFSDQFGGNSGRKFGSTRFQQLFLDIHHEDMKTQEKIIKKTHKEWREHYKQLDDIVVIGIRF